MKSKTSISQNRQNVTITINTLRENAGEMLRVANHLEATQHFIGNGITPAVHARSPGTRRRLSIVGRRKIAKANASRTGRRKELPVVGKTAAA